MYCSWVVGVGEVNGIKVAACSRRTMSSRPTPLYLAPTLGTARLVSEAQCPPAVNPGNVVLATLADGRTAQGIVVRLTPEVLVLQCRSWWSGVHQQVFERSSLTGFAKISS